MLPNGGKLRIGTAINAKKGELLIFFADTGQGIPKEYLNSIFLPFFTVGSHSGRHGLGLSFAYQIIKNHDGRLDVESREGRGTTFTAVLPLGSRT
jgi:signal transduction histidine kinase